MFALHVQHVEYFPLLLTAPLGMTVFNSPLHITQKLTPVVAMISVQIKHKASKPTPQNPHHFKPYPSPNIAVQSLLILTSIYIEKEQSYGR